MDFFTLQEAVNQVHCGLDCLWKQAELHLDHDKPVDEDLAILCSQDGLPFEVASRHRCVLLICCRISCLQTVILAISKQVLMDILDVVALDELSRRRQSQLINDILSRLLEGLLVVPV